MKWDWAVEYKGETAHWKTHRNKALAYQDRYAYILRADCSLCPTSKISTQDKLAAHAAGCLQVVTDRLSAGSALPLFCVHMLLAIGTSSKRTLQKMFCSRTRLWSHLNGPKKLGPYKKVSLSARCMVTVKEKYFKTKYMSAGILLGVNAIMSQI